MYATNEQLKMRWTLLVLVLWLGACQSSGEKSQGQEINGADVEQGDTSAPRIDPYDDNWNNIGSQNNQRVQSSEENEQEQSENYEQYQDQQAENTYEEETENPFPQYQIPEETISQETDLGLQYDQSAQVTPPLQQASNYAGEPEPLPPSLPPLAQGPVVPDLLPEAAELWWVGFDYQPRDALVKVEMITRGSPRFDFLQERNQAGQPELIVRFYQTSLRHKVRRDMDASEFASPLAYLRMRPDESEMHVDVIMTLRDPVRPRMYAKDGNLLLTFAIPDKYFGNSDIGVPAIGTAQLLAKADLIPDADEGSELPFAKTVTPPDPGGEVFGEVPDEATAPLPLSAVVEAPFNEVDAPLEETNLFANESISTPEVYEETNDVVLPADFDNTQTPAGNVQYDNYEPSQLGNSQYDVQGGNESTGGQYDQGTSYQYQNQGSQAEGQGGDYESNYEEFEDDDLEDFDDGDGEAVEEVDLFNVQIIPVARFGLGAVAQDNYEYEDLNDTAEYTADEGQTEGEATEATDTASDDYGEDEYGVEDATLDENSLPADTIGTQANSNYGTNTNLGLDDPEGNLPFEETPAATPNGTVAADPAGAPAAIDPFASAPSLGSSNYESNTTGNYGSDAPNPFAVESSGDYEPPLDDSISTTGTDAIGNDSEFIAPRGIGKPIKMDFRGAPLSEVIRVLSEESGINFVFPNEIGGQLVYLSLNNVPFSQALEALLQSQSLGKLEIAANLIRIDRLEVLQKESDARAQAVASQRQLTPTKVLVMRLSYAEAEKIAPLITAMLKKDCAGAAPNQAQRDCDGRVTVQPEARTNSVIVEATPNDLSKAKALIERLDLQTPQVKIASRIMEVTKTFGRFLGLAWTTPFDFNQGRGLSFGNLVFPNNLTSRFAVDPGVGSQNRVGTFDFRFGSINNAVNLDLRLRMEQAEGTTEILQTNNVLVEDNQEAKIEAGNTDIFRVIIDDKISTTEVNYTLAMTVTPHITADGAIQMKLDIKSAEPAVPSSPNAETGTKNKSVNTALLRRSGETAVIGGMYNSSRILQKTGVPYLSSIPIIGALFRSTNRNDTQRELIIMVTPTIVSSAKGGPSIAAVNSEYDLGNTGNEYSNDNYGGTQYQGTNTNNYDSGLQQQSQQENQYGGGNVGAFNYQGNQGTQSNQESYQGTNQSQQYQNNQTEYQQGGEQTQGQNAQGTEAGYEYQQTDQY